MCRRASGFVERRKGGETGIEAVQCIRGPETWKWVDRNPWAGNLLDAVRKSFDLKPGHFQEGREAERLYRGLSRRDESGGIFGRGRGVDLRRRNRRAVKTRRSSRCLAGPGPISQYHAANAYEHWLIEMMLTRKEPYNAERLLLSTGIVNVQHGFKLGERPLLCRRTPHRDAVHGHDLSLDTRDRSLTRGRGRRVIPYIRGFEK